LRGVSKRMLRLCLSIHCRSRALLACSTCSSMYDSVRVAAATCRMCLTILISQSPTPCSGVVRRLHNIISRTHATNACGTPAHARLAWWNTAVAGAVLTRVCCAHALGKAGICTPPPTCPSRTHQQLRRTYQTGSVLTMRARPPDRTHCAHAQPARDSPASRCTCSSGINVPAAELAGRI
jgi:hypothetical protein